MHQENQICQIYKRNGATVCGEGGVWNESICKKAIEKLLNLIQKQFPFRFHGNYICV